jgi:hypothetical protein
MSSNTEPSDETTALEKRNSFIVNRRTGWTVTDFSTLADVEAVVSACTFLIGHMLLPKVLENEQVLTPIYPFYI